MKRHGKNQKDTENAGHKIEPGRKSNPRIKQATRNRCSHASPDRKSISQLTEPTKSYKSLTTVKPLRSTSASARTLNIQEPQRSVLQVEHTKVDNSCQLTIEHTKVDNSCQLTNKEVEYYNGTEWQIIDDIDKYIQENYGKYLPASPKNCRAVHIAEIPRVKIIAEKYSRYKQNNVELRKLDEKVVCVEYDVFQGESLYVKPIQVMRAFFSIKPVADTDIGKTLTELPPALRDKFDITSGDLQKLCKKEVEIIDGKIAENQAYLDDLRKILRYEQVFSNSTTLDLQTLYEIANTDNFHYGRYSNLLSKVELQEVKDLILKTCRSSVYGINRRTVRASNRREYGSNVISQSIICELLRKDSGVSR